MKMRGIFQLIASTIFFLSSSWCLLWMFASADLTFIACDGKYSMFHELFRCRQPNIAFILWLGFGVACVSFLYFGVKNLRRTKDNEKNT
jgi:hypothetical protein